MTRTHVPAAHDLGHDAARKLKGLCKSWTLDWTEPWTGPWTGLWTAIWTKFWTHLEHHGCTKISVGAFMHNIGLAGSLLNKGKAPGAGFMLIRCSC